MTKEIITLLALVFMPAFAQAQSFMLDATDGSETFLVNAGSEPITIYAYALYSTNGTLNPEGWNSIESQVAGPGGLDLITELGIGFAGFGESNPTDQHLCELNQPGAIWPAGYRLSIGQAWPDPDFDDVNFKYTTKSGGEWTTFDGEIIPEPATLTLLGLGAVTALRRRRI